MPSLEDRPMTTTILIDAAPGLPPRAIRPTVGSSSTRGAASLEGPVSKSIEERFWEKVRKSPEPDGCWEWTASKFRNGYGSFVVLGERRAHRVSWEIHNGPIPDGLWVLHKCDNPSCVRPDHLFLGDRRTNMLDCVSKGRHRWKNKVACVNGHPYTDENTFHKKRKGGGVSRRCRTCRRDQKKACMARTRLLAKPSPSPERK